MESLRQPHSKATPRWHCSGLSTCHYSSPLERFGKPWYSRSTLHVFRDQTDLALTPDLPRELQKALERSEFFILLARPDAARSTWVEKELQFWVQHRSARRLFIVLTGGTLRWVTDDFDWNETTALPRSLRGSSKANPFGPT